MNRGGPCGPLTISANITDDLGEYLRQIVHTFFLVLPMFCSLAGVMLIFMNLFAVVGMELFGGERPHASHLPCPYSVQSHTHREGIVHENIYLGMPRREPLR